MRFLLLCVEHWGQEALDSGRDAMNPCPYAYLMHNCRQLICPLQGVHCLLYSQHFILIPSSKGGFLRSYGCKCIPCWQQHFLISTVPAFLSCSGSLLCALQGGCVAASLKLTAPWQDIRRSVSEQVVPRKSVVPQAFLSGCSVLGGVDQQLQQTRGLAFRCLPTSRETPSASSQCLFYDCEGKGGRRQLVWSILSLTTPPSFSVFSQ